MADTWIVCGVAILMLDIFLQPDSDSMESDRVIDPTNGSDGEPSSVGRTSGEELSNPASSRQPS
jgi:hypothetical protein